MGNRLVAVFDKDDNNEEPPMNADACGYENQNPPAMTRKERFLAALGHQRVDRVPMFDFLFQQPMYEELIGHRPGAYNGPDAVRCALALDHDGVWLPFGGFSGFQPKFLAENVYVDEWGTTYQRNDSSWPIDAPVDYPIKSRADLARYRPPDPTLPGRDAEIRAASAMETDGLAILGGVLGPFAAAWMMMGYEGLSYALYDDPEMVGQCCQISNEYNKEAARRSVAAGCDGMWVSDDYGSSHQGFLRLEHFRRYVLPHFAELVEYVASLGVPVLLHSCGQVMMYLDDFAQTKIASIHPLQRTAKMDLRTVKEKYGKRFCLIGNIDSSRTLPYGTSDDVAREVREAIDIAAPGGGYILASDHSLHDGIPVENIRTLFQVGASYGRAYYV
jgi:uroporphyrinogen decarboxylase